MVYANRLCTARLIAPPPTISQMNSTSAISSGFAPAFQRADVRGDAQRRHCHRQQDRIQRDQHIHHRFWQQVERVEDSDHDEQDRKPRNGDFAFLAAACRSKLFNPRREIRNGASIITRSILAMTAAFSASGLMA